MVAGEAAGVRARAQSPIVLWGHLGMVCTAFTHRLRLGAQVWPCPMEMVPVWEAPPCSGGTHVTPADTNVLLFPG